MREFERNNIIMHRRQREEMKKKVVALMMVATMAASVNITAFAAPAQTAPAATESTVSGDDVSYADVMKAVDEYYATEGSIATYASEVATTPAAFDWGNVSASGSGVLSPILAVKLSDPSATSMANDAIVSATVSRYRGAATLSIETKPISMSGITGHLKSLEVYYYASADATEMSSVTVTPDDGSNVVTVTLPKGAYGLSTSTKPTASDGTVLNNMVKVKITTDIEDKWYGNIVPDTMKNPTCFVAFNATAN